jgi:hypothetical protein
VAGRVLYASTSWHTMREWLSCLIDRQNSIVQFLSRMLARFFGVKYKNLPNLEEAIVFLKTEDASINWDQMDESPLSERSG